MNKYVETAKALRNDTNVHYSCAQATLLPFSRELGISDEMAMKFSDNFGGGMRTASVCGAITGGLMAMGLLGINNPDTVVEFWRKIKDNHGGFYECKNLLAENAKTGIPRIEHCDNMVYEVVQIISDMI